MSFSTLYSFFAVIVMSGILHHVLELFISPGGSDVSALGIRGKNARPGLSPKFNAQVPVANNKLCLYDTLYW